MHVFQSPTPPVYEQPPNRANHAVPAPVKPPRTFTAAPRQPEKLPIHRVESPEVQQEKRSQNVKHIQLVMALVASVPLTAIASTVTPALLALIVTWLGIGFVVLASNIKPPK